VATDIQVLNYALTLEHLENAFYAGALARFDDKAFRDAGLPSEARVRFSEVAFHEATHVLALRAALALLGGQATQPCTYYLCVFFFEWGFRTDLSNFL
jgi:Ferritin-like domain